MSDALEQASNTAIAVEEAPPKEKIDRERREKEKTSPPQKDRHWHVVLWNDDDHTPRYVIELLMTLFRHPYETASEITNRVDKEGRAIALTCHKELAELKRDLVLNYGEDPYSDVRTGPLRATIEPAPE